MTARSAPLALGLQRAEPCWSNHPIKRGIEAGLVASVPQVLVAKAEERFLMPPGEDADLGPLTPLLATGIIDSFGIMELLEFIRGRFGVVLPENDINAESVEHLQKISALVLRVHGQSGARA